MFKKIIWAADGSPSSGRVQDAVQELANDNKASVLAIHVQEHFSLGRKPVLADSHQALDEFLQSRVEELKKDGIAAELLLAESRSGHAAHVLADLAREAGADLIVAGTHGQGPVAGFFLGGFTIHLLQAASCPVLVVPRDPRGGA
jgi:nucleotide-binding universal stress UspA family protein